MLSVGLCAARSRVAASTRPGSTATIALVISSWIAEDVLEVAVVALGPGVSVGLRIEQLRGNAHAVAGATTLPSSTYCTPSSRATLFTSTVWPLHLKEVLREITNSS